MIRIIRAFFTNMLQGLLGPFQASLASRGLFWVLMRRDMVIRTHGTILGGLWPLLQPALQILGFWFLFDIVYSMRANVGPAFLNYLLVGMLPWLCVAEILSRAANMFAEFSPLYRRSPFPLAILPVLIMAIPCLVYMLVYFGVNLLLFDLKAALLSLPVFPLLMLWLLPLCYLFPVLGVFFKDFKQAVPFMLTLVMYMTPILYFRDMVPEKVGLLLMLNPIADLMALIHGLIQDMDMGPENFLRPLLLWLLLLGPAWLLFRRSAPHVRELL